jgi:hypothetical protein
MLSTGREWIGRRASAAGRFAPGRSARGDWRARVLAIGVLVSGVTAAGLLGGATASAGGAPGGSGQRAPVASAARTLEVKDESHMHLVRESGSLLLEEGTATGTLPGTVKVRFDVGATVTAYFTIYSRSGGSISGHGKGALHSTGAYATFGGTLSVTSGTGRFAHASGNGGLYGAINRRTYALTVQTIGKLDY